MRTRESIYTPLGYTVTYVKREKFKGWGTAPVEIELCIARKNSTQFFVFSDRDGFYPSIMRIQDSIPHMACFREPAAHHILMDSAAGQLIWHMDSVPNVASVPLGDDEMLVLCSDGLHKHVEPQEISRQLRAHVSLARCCTRLVDLARMHGSNDDATVLVVHRTAQPEPAQP